MPKTTAAAETPLQGHLDRLASFEPAPFPVLSLYLNMQADQHGRDRYDVFLRGAFSEHARTYRNGSPERKSFDVDVQRINHYLHAEMKPSANGVAVFACSGKDGFFEPLQLDAPLDEHWLYVGDEPHLYPLARLNDQYPRYAAVAVDSNSAKLFVFAPGAAQRTEQVHGMTTRRTSAGGWSQNRYQRHVDNFRLQHAREVVAVLDRVVRDEKIQHIVLSGDEAALALVKSHLPRHLAEKAVEVEKGDVRAPGHEIFEDTFAALRRLDAETDIEKVDDLIGAWRANGLGVVGARDTLRALTMGQVEELLISDLSIPLSAVDAETARLADELVTKARQTGVRITFIENRSLLADVGGVGALLRFRL